MFQDLKLKRICAPLILALTLLLNSTAFAQHYNRTDLTTDPASGITALNQDPNLINAWGLARSSASPWWVADNGTGLSTLYNASGVPQSLVVTIPPPEGQDGPATPTGTVFNFTNRFDVKPHAKAIFIFVTEDGTISAWNPTVDLTHAILKVNRAKDAVYKGIAIASTRQGPRIYVSNFKSGHVEIFDGGWNMLSMPGAFEDPTLPENYVPFGIQNVGGNIVVTFAHRLPGAEDEDHGAGLGFVTIFNTSGQVIGRLAHGNYFNAPWGITMSPADFGAFSHRLLIGNFGNGKIHAFDPITGAFEGTLLDSSGHAISVDGLWALQFGGGNTNSGAANELFFTAGPHEEADGLLGKIAPVATEQRGSSE
jgi:uncharacterized protein (TIGR03118 family)